MIVTEVYINGEWVKESTESQVLPSARDLGRLGGLVKSEVKSTTARANGRKGGRPAVKQLDIEDI